MLRARLGQAIPTGTRARDGVAIMQADLSQPRLWLLGHEGQGLSTALSQLPGQQWVSIPQSPQQESLNVAVAAGICLYEQFRQRTTDATPAAVRSSA
jgi:TrmH family RNA methyltransferase